MLALQQAWKGNIWEHISFSAGINLPVDHFLILSGVFLGLSTKLKNMLFIDVYCNVSPNLDTHATLGNSMGHQPQHNIHGDLEDHQWLGTNPLNGNILARLSPKKNIDNYHPHEYCR
jgi:hypothetical protein